MKIGPKALLHLPILLAVLASSGCVHWMTSFTPTSGMVLADTTADTRALILAAWEDQVRFERYRLMNLPALFAPSPVTRQPCNELVVRFCLADDDAAGTYNYIRDPDDIAVHRADLVRALSDIGRRVPDDDWVIGQWVRYAVEAGLYESALEGTLRCAGTDWWCSALAGYTLHRSGRPAEAEVAFAAALSRMPAAERQRWIDPLPVLEPATAELLHGVPTERLHQLISTFWRLADPFLSRPGNEILSEHLARRVEIQFQYAAGFLEGLPWGQDLDEIQLRYGTPRNRIAGMGGPYRGSLAGPPFGVPDLISNYRMPGIRLLPPIGADFQVGKGEWDEVDRTPRAGYNIELNGAPVRWIPPLAHQVALFRRDGSAIVVGAFDAAAHNLSDEVTEGGVAFIPWDDLGTDPVTARLAGAAAAGRALMMTIEPRPGLLSMEVFIPGQQAVARFRRPLEPASLRTDSLAISDILLIQSDVRPDSLAAAVAVARGSNRVRPGEAVGLFWETYGVDAEEHPEVSISLRLIPAAPTLLQRLGQIFRVVRPAVPTEVRWVEETSPGPWMARSVALTIPNLSEGVHTLELAMEVGDQQPLVSRTEIVIGPVVIRDLVQGEVTRRPLLRRILCGDVPDDELVVGNEGNLAVSREIRESVAMSEYFAQAWEFPPVYVPQGWSCTEYVRTKREYFGHGPQPQ